MACIAGNSNLWLKAAVAMGNTVMRQAMPSPAAAAAAASLTTTTTTSSSSSSRNSSLFYGTSSFQCHTNSGFPFHRFLNPAGSQIYDLSTRPTAKSMSVFPYMANISRGLHTASCHGYHSTPLPMTSQILGSSHGKTTTTTTKVTAWQQPPVLHHSHHHHHNTPVRHLHTSHTLRQNNTDNSNSGGQTTPVNQQQPEPRPKFTEKMTLRLVAENGFLSWTRNAYLSSAAGATMLNGSSVELIQHAGVLALVVSAMNMAWGSGCHLSNLVSIRNHSTMSRPVLFLNLLGTVLHALLWLFILAYFIRFSAHTCRHDPDQHHHHHHHPHHHHRHHPEGHDGHHLNPESASSAPK